MPTYSSRCSKCGSEKDYFAKVADRNETPVCCATPTERMLTAAMVPQVGIATGRSGKYQELAKKGIVPASDMTGEAEYRMKNIKQDQAKINREIVENVVKTY